MDDPTNQLPTLHDKVVQAHADVQYIASLPAAPLSEQNRKACLKRARHAVDLLHHAATGLSMTRVATRKHRRQEDR